MNQLPYEFSDDERAIRFDRMDLPAPWINYLSNGRMHAFISQAGGGMLWWKSPMTFRITRYRFYNLPMDTPGFYIYIRKEDGTVWSPAFTPCETPVDERTALHKPGSSVFTAERDGLKAILTLFIAPDYDTLIWDLAVENESGAAVTFDVFAYAELSQFLAQQEFTLGYYLKWNTRAVYEKDLEAITYAYTAWMHPRAAESPLVYFGSDRAADAFCCNRDIFCGNYRDERNPQEVEKGQLSNSNLNGGEPCAALQRKVVLSANEKKRLQFYLGVVPGALSSYETAIEKTKQILEELRTPGTIDSQNAKNRQWWDEQLSVLQAKLPDPDAEREINTWNPLQCVNTGRFSRAISAAASGVRGIGFRDTAQDMLAQAYRRPEWATEMLYYLAGLQLSDGHPVHIAWPEDNKPPQDITRSDNHLWLVYLTYAIIAETGDISILDHEIPFLSSDLVGTDGSATLWEHLLRGIDFTEKHLGAHGLPLILFSDWNDHLGPFGRKGRGESLMVAEQLIWALRELAELARLRKDEETATHFDVLREAQEKALAEIAWDGEWFIRGLDDEGQPVGSHTASHMRIWLNAQSWMVIAGCGKKEQLLKAMDSANRELDTGLGLLLNAPGWPGWPDAKESMVNGLPAGYSENGGVFCQANCWAIMAEALLGRGNRAWQYYLQILPHNVIKKIGVENYHSEAYAWSSTMLGIANERFGMGCVSQVSGTAAWMDIVATQYLLGIRPTLSGLLIDPAIPAEWDGFSIIRKYRGFELYITVDNPTHVEHDVKSFYINGVEMSAANGALIKEEMLKSGYITNIQVVMG